MVSLIKIDWRIEMPIMTKEDAEKAVAEFARDFCCSLRLPETRETTRSMAMDTYTFKVALEAMYLKGVNDALAIAAETVKAE